MSGHTKWSVLHEKLMARPGAAEALFLPELFARPMTASGRGTTPHNEKVSAVRSRIR
jgi:hypothetical protein